MVAHTTNIAQSYVSEARFGSWTTRLCVFMLFVVLSVVMTYPLVLNLSTAVPGPPFDNFVWLYDLWWFRHSIVDLGEWPIINPNIFYPFGYDLRLSETMLANKALIAAVLFWGDEVLAYNIFLLVSFVLTGYAMYLLIAYLTGNPYAAVVGGAIFAFCPYRIHAMAAGWLPLLATQWIPLTFLYLERMWAEGRARHALAAGFFGALNALSSWYYVYVVGTFVLLYIVMRVWPWIRRRWVMAQQVPAHLARNLILAGVMALVMVAPAAYPVAAARMRGIGEMSWSLADVEKWAASLEDFFLPNVYHPLWGEHFLSQRAYTLRYPWYAPGFVYLGGVALLLALIGLLGRHGESNLIGALGWLAFFSFVLALGAVLHWKNEVLAVSVPPKVEALAERILSTLISKWALHKASYYDITFPSGTIPIPLPGLLLYLFVPLGNALRTFYRFGVITIFAVAVLAGIGTARMIKGRRPFLSLVGTVFFLGLVLLDFGSVPLPFGFSEVRPQPLDRWLVAQPESVVIMQFPLTRALSGDSLYRTKYHGKRVAYGHGTFYPTEYRDAMGVLGGFPSQESLDLLKSWGVSHVVVGSQIYDVGWGDVWGQTWDAVRGQIEASGRLRMVAFMRDEPFWRDERISGILYGNPPVVPGVVDQVYVYELK